MKIAILGFTKVKYMPYLHFYLNQIDKSENDVHLIYWNRDENQDAPMPEGVVGHSYDKNMDDSIPLRKKLPLLFGYGRYAKKIIKEIKPDFIIVLHSTTGVTVRGLLKHKYKKRYIFDYRDVTYERNFIYRKMVAKLVKNAALTFTSSDGFRNFLPEGEEILTSHNLTRDVLDNRETFRYKREGEKIRLAFWGLLRHYTVNKQIAERLGNDDRFELHYYGRAQGAMAQFVEESPKQYNNFFFHGEYKSADRLKFAAENSIVHNVYSNNDKSMPVAMANKYYDGPIFYLPQLCMTDSFMGKKITNAGIGLECNPADEDFADKIYEYYINLDFNSFFDNCDKELEAVMQEVEFGEKRIKEVLDNAQKAKKN